MGGREKGGLENMAKRRKVSEIYSENNSKIFNCLKIREFLRLPVFRGGAGKIHGQSKNVLPILGMPLNLGLDIRPVCNQETTIKRGQAHI
jgi:hypothetical protein